MTTLQPDPSADPATCPTCGSVAPSEETFDLPVVFALPPEPEGKALLVRGGSHAGEVWSFAPPADTNSWAALLALAGPSGVEVLGDAADIPPDLDKPGIHLPREINTPEVRQAIVAALADELRAVYREGGAPARQVFTAVATGEDVPGRLAGGVYQVLDRASAGLPLRASEPDPPDGAG